PMRARALATSRSSLHSASSPRPNSTGSRTRRAAVVIDTAIPLAGALSIDQLGAADDLALGGVVGVDLAVERGAVAPHHRLCGLARQRAVALARHGDAAGLLEPRRDLVRGFLGYDDAAERHADDIETLLADGRHVLEVGLALRREDAEQPKALG